MGGSGSHAELADTYNKMHFPSNLNYKQLNPADVKKTLQGDMAKLLRDKLISREYKRPARRDPYRASRKFGYYTITPYGYHYIKLYNICKQLEVTK